MRGNKLMLAVAAMAMTASPVLAANPTSRAVAPASARSSAQAGESELAGGGGFFVAIIAIVAVIAGVIIVASNNDDPDSP